MVLGLGYTGHAPVCPLTSSGVRLDISFTRVPFQTCPEILDFLPDLGMVPS